MPASPGFAAVRERVGAVRRRANRLTLLETLCGGVAALSAAGTAVVAAAVWASRTGFLLVAAAAAVALSAASVALAYRHWRRRLGLLAAARLADRHGRLADRLLTLVTLRAGPAHSPLGDVLAAQAWQLRDRWQPEAVVPARVRTAALALLAAAVPPAALTLLLHVRPPLTGTPSAQPVSAEARAPADHPGNAAARTLAAASPRSGRADDGADRPDMWATGSQAETAGDGTADPGEVAGGEPEADATTRLATVPARVQDAIRAAVAFGTDPRLLPGGGEASGPSRLAARPRPPGGSGASGDLPGGSPPGADAAGSPSRAEPGLGAEHPRGSAQPDGREGSLGGDPGARQRPERPGAGSGEARRDGHAATPGRSDGGSVPAGGGSDGAPLGVAAADATADAAAAGAPFRLTLTTFLEARGAGAPAARRTGGGTASSAAGSASAAAGPQWPDDLLRRADVPPDYEALVRKVYSAGREAQ